MKRLRKYLERCFRIVIPYHIDKFETGLRLLHYSKSKRQVQPTVTDLDTQIEVINLRSKRGNKILYDCLEMGTFKKS